MTRQYTTKPAKLLKRTGNHVRLDLGDRSSLLPLGQSYLARPLHPIISDVSTLEIYDGNRRVAAVMLIDPDAELPVCLIDEPWNDSVKLEVQMESAAHTKGLSDFEQYLGCSGWLELNPGATAKQLATRIHLDEGVLSKILSLSKGIAEVKEAAKAGLIGYPKWHPICRRPAEEQAGLLAECLNGATRDELQEKTRRNGNGTSPARLPKITIPLSTKLPAGIIIGTITVAARDIDLATTETLLKAAAKVVAAAREENMSSQTAQLFWADQQAKAGA